MIAVKNKRPRYFELTKPEVQFLFGLQASLTAAEWRMWLYLVTLDPFGDVGAKFDAEELMYFCNIQKSTYFAAKAKFIKLGLFEFVDGSAKVRNLKGSKAKCDSEISNFNSEMAERRSEISNFNSEISEWQTPEPISALESGTPHTLSDVIQTLSDSLNATVDHAEITETRDEIEILDLEIQENTLEVIANDPKLIANDREPIINDPLPLKEIDQDPDKKEELKISQQKTITTNPLTPKKVGEEKEQVPPPPAAPEFSFLDWVKYYKAKNARNPLIYAQTCIRRDDGSLRAEYERWLAIRKDPVFSVYAPEPIVVPPPEERSSIIANVKEMLRSRGLKI